MQVVKHELQQLLCPVGLRVEAHQVGAHGVALQAEELERTEKTFSYSYYCMEM